jgi:phosphoribosylformylglycinamidine (FGAM) synthase PurS component
MTKRAVSISLKIPDNAAYTALVALRRLGVNVHRVERSEVRFFDDNGESVDALVQRITTDETIFNPNKHRIIVLDDAVPRAGEVWIEPLSGAVRRAIAWRLFDAEVAPVARDVLDEAIERLLCNPAIDRAVTNRNEHDRDISSGSE